MIFWLFPALFLIWLTYTTIFSWILRTVLGRLLHSEVTVAKIRWLGFYDLRLTTADSVNVVVDRAKITSSFFNASFSKPLVLCVNDLRIEIVRLPKQQKKAVKAEGGKALNGAGTFRHLTTLLQYLAVELSNVQLIVLDTGDCLPPALLHFSIGKVVLDNFCQRHSLSSELNCELVSVKLLTRAQQQQHSSLSTNKCENSSVVSTGSLLELSLELCVTANFDLSSRKLAAVRVSVRKPVVDIAANFVHALLAARKLDDKETNLPTVVSDNNNMSSGSEPSIWIPSKVSMDVTSARLQANGLLGAQHEITCDLREATVELDRTIVKSGCFGSGAAVAVAINDFLLKDSCRSWFRITVVSINVQRDAQKRQRKFRITGVGFTLAEDTLNRTATMATQYGSTGQNVTSTTPKYIATTDENLEIINSFEVTEVVGRVSLAPSGLADVRALQIQTQLFSIVQVKRGASFASLEIGLDNVFCRTVLLGKTSDPNKAGQVERKSHEWGTVIAVGACLARVNVSPVSVKCKVLCDDCQVEYSAPLLRFLERYLTVLTFDKGPTVHTVNDRPRKTLSGTVTMSGFAVFCPIAQRIYTAVLADKLHFESSSAALGLNLLTLHMLHGPLTGAERFDWSDAAVYTGTTSFATVPQLSCNLERQTTLLTVHAPEHLFLRWSPVLHLSLFTVIEDVVRTVSHATAKKKSVDFTTTGTSSNQGMGFNVKLMAESEVKVHLDVFDEHVVQFVLPHLRALRSQSHAVLAETDRIEAHFDGHRIIALNGVRLQRHPDQLFSVTAVRKEYPELMCARNPCWELDVKDLAVQFPYEYDFAAAYEECINVVKWAKVLHNVKRREFSVESPLPPDLSFSFGKVVIELCDDPFEVSLRDNYELQLDEQNEGERRLQMLYVKIEEMRRAFQLLPKAKLDELVAALLRKNADIYVQRRRQYEHGVASAAQRTQLFGCVVDNLQVRVVADSSLHGTENVLWHMAQFDPDSPPPPSDQTFVTHWCRVVALDLDEWRMTMRDYPQPYLCLKGGHLWGKLAGAEQEGSVRAKRTCVYAPGDPWPQFELQRNMPPLKFYYDLTIDATECMMAYGPCWEPCLAMVGLCSDLISKPSKDPSPAMPFWDKIRMLLHGRLSMACEQLTMVFLASSDPYNTAEQMEMMWKMFAFDWTNGTLLFKGDHVDAYVRTASKYDDARVAHLPGLKCIVKLHWECINNPNDHNAVSPCAPDKLPEHSLNAIHDSYRGFRSSSVSMHASIELKEDEYSRERFQPQLQFYASTFRWLDQLKNTWSAVNRPVRRGNIFARCRPKKLQLSRHFKAIQLAVKIPRFLISYWMSYTSNFGMHFLGKDLQLSSAHKFVLVNASNETLVRRPCAQWSTEFMNAELLDLQVYLFSERIAGELSEMYSKDNFLLSLTKLAYTRPSSLLVAGGSDGAAADRRKTDPVHHLVLHDLRGCWAARNRDVVLAVFDGLQKSRSLKRNLSTEALREYQLAADDQSDSRRSRADTRLTDTAKAIQSTKAEEMLMQLVQEVETKFTAYAEDVSESEIPGQQLLGPTLCQMDDVLFKNWQIELVNGQVLLRGVQTSGYVLGCAARANIVQCIHRPAWRENQLLAKDTWVASLSGMQYYATVTGGNDPDHDVQWLSRDFIETRESRASSAVVADVVDSLMTDSGESAGGVIGDVSFSGADSEECGDQLQRIVSRCSCQIYFCHFSELEDSVLQGAPLPAQPVVDPDESFGAKPDTVAFDCFTLKHNQINSYTNHVQYDVILDVVNNLLLFVDPKKKEYAEKLQRLRFQHQLQSVDDLRPNILVLQNHVRDVLANLRHVERQVYQLNKQMSADSSSGNSADHDDFHHRHESLRNEVEQSKLSLAAKGEELAMLISCFKEKQLQKERESTRMGKTGLFSGDAQQQSQIARRFELCFEDAQWRMTETDGQLGLADIQIRNFLYTKVSRINNSGEHLLEVGYVKITNLLPNSPYRDVLQLHRNTGLDRQLAARILCRELAPVGGISVKEHFEINVAPMRVQLTYAFFRTVMKYFFPDKNIDKADQQVLDTDDGVVNASGQSSSKGGTGKNGTPKRNKPRKDEPGAHPTDDIDKMKQRAEKNNMFLYIKVPEVPFLVSYKGEKEKNLEDVENFQLQFPLVEYHDRNWTWLDLSLAIKQRSKRVLVQQYMKQKLLKGSKGAGLFGSSHDGNLVSLPEEQKAKLLLGSYHDKTIGKRT